MAEHGCSQGAARATRCWDPMRRHIAGARNTTFHLRWRSQGSQTTKHPRPAPPHSGHTQPLTQSRGWVGPALQPPCLALPKRPSHNLRVSSPLTPSHACDEAPRRPLTAAPPPSSAPPAARPAARQTPHSCARLLCAPRMGIRESPGVKRQEEGCAAPPTRRWAQRLHLLSVQSQHAPPRVL